ncbi:sensor histidine kinase [Alloscardovia venturai]|uniref:histidine kinase n=1 Tax=Alloscardovia venturai TaxID=1769421 RepID=A0ABW2Y278_9BIFI
MNIFAHNPSITHFTRQILFLFMSLLFVMLVNGLFLISAAYLGTVKADNTSKVEHIAHALTCNSSGTCNLSSPVREELRSSHNWAMFLDKNGHVIWSYRKPRNIPNTYSRADIASFTRWYLKDYPVDVWTSNGNLLVLGYPRDSLWKFLLVQDMRDMWFFPVGLLLNVAMLLIITYAITRFNAHERSKARTEWIAAVSHDVRTPLQLILAYSDEISHNLDNDEETQSLAQQIVANTNHVALLISDLNMANRLEYASQSLTMKKQRIAPLIRSTIAQIINEGIEEKYDIAVNISDETQKVEAKTDASLFSRMITNLVRNSIKHNPDGCTITISATITRSGFLKHKKNLEIIVADSGSGYPQDILSSLRDVNSQYSHSALKTLPEHGLGLVIVSRIAGAHHGFVEFRNSQTGSSETIITIPCA